MTNEQAATTTEGPDVATMKANAVEATTTKGPDSAADPDNKPSEDKAADVNQGTEKPEQEPEPEGAVEVEEEEAEEEEFKADDESWWGKALPSTEVLAVIGKNLDDAVVKEFVKASRQYAGVDGNVKRLVACTNSFVNALRLVPENMQMSAGFGEISLAYGKALLRFVEMEGSGSAAVASKIVKMLQEAVASGKALGGDDDDDGMIGNVEETKAGGEDDITGVKVKEDGEADEAEEDLQDAWTQLEVSRVIFKQHKMVQREAECRYTLGELLMSCDEGNQASSEFATAATLFDNKRRKAECYYKQYVAIRNEDRVQGCQALTQSVDMMGEVKAEDDTEAVLEDMKLELKDLKATMEKETDGGKIKALEGDAVTEVQVVRPKRKRDVVVAGAVAGAEKVAVEEAEELQNGKKARVQNGNGAADKTP